VKAPAAVGAKLTSHDPFPPATSSVQLAPLGPNDPPIEAVKLTVPVAIVAPVLAVSVTATVQVVACPPSSTDAGEQFTLVLVGSTVPAEVRVDVVPLLPACSVSPK
jgi:hypothetical protein